METILNTLTGYSLAGLPLALIAIGLLVAIFLRRVVPTNEVHIIQTAKKTTSYGKDSGNGNSYYEWPSWIPLLGVTRVTLPMSVFDLDLEDYEAYDRGRLPFMVDVKAFFRIIDSNTAAQRVYNFQELHSQLKAIVQGAVRTVLANNEIEEIMQGRSKFGEEFTIEVNEQLQNWGVATVKTIELMDIRDTKTTQVIHNIMEKKKSQIEMESRTEVAKNKRIAQVAEIEAKQQIDTRAQEAQQVVGLRTVENQREVALAQQTANQAVKESEKTTKEKEMAVLRISQLRQAEITREATIVKAEQDRQQTVIAAEAGLEQAKREAEANLERAKRNAEGVLVEGNAKAEAEKAMQLAPVEAQIRLAKEIGGNEGYQNYLVTVRKVEASQAVGIEQAKALEKAEIKIIANSGDASSGMNSVLDVFSSKGGTAIGAMLDGLANTETGSRLLRAKGLESEGNGELRQ